MEEEEKKTLMTMIIIKTAFNLGFRFQRESGISHYLMMQILIT
jgi:hypothetical protein